MRRYAGKVLRQWVRSLESGKRQQRQRNSLSQEFSSIDGQSAYGWL